MIMISYEKRVKYIFWCYMDSATGLVLIKDHRLCFKANHLCSELILRLISPSEVKICFYGMEKLSQRTLSPGKDYKNSSKDYKLQTPALYFPNQFPSGLPLPFPLFLSNKDDLPRGIMTNNGLNKKTLLFPPSSFFSLYRSIHLSIRCSAIYGKFVTLP